MKRERMVKLLGGLALLSPITGPAWADEPQVGPSPNQLYAAEQVLQNVAAQQPVAPEQAVPQSTESRAPDAAILEGIEEAAEEDGYLMQQLRCHSIGSWLDCNGIKISGWLDQGFTWNPDSPGNRFNFPTTFNDRANEYQMNQFYLIMEKAVDTESCCWDFGGRVDFLYGSDYYFTTALGLETHGDGSQRWNSEDGPRFQFGPAALYGAALPQAYAEIYAPIGNGLTMKVGHFYTIIGNEVVPSNGNFFYSHAYTMQYGEPFTHTGVLSSYKLTDGVTLNGGITRGWDTWEDNNENLGFLGGVTWTSCDELTSVAFGIHIGDEPSGLTGIDDDRTMYSLVVTQKISDRLTYIFQHDLGFQDAGGVNNAGNLDDAEWYGINQYLIYEINNCLSAGLRLEWFRDDDNVRVIPVGPAADGTNYFELTAGLNYKPFENVRIRPELRWDWSNFDLGPFGAYDDFSDKNQFTAAVSAILTF